MESVETLIPDNKGNHLVVALHFYDETIKLDSFEIPLEFSDLDIADISINKLDPDRPLGLSAFNGLCSWLIGQFLIFPNSVFSFICSTNPLDTNHEDLSSEEYRWALFESLLKRNKRKLDDLEIISRDIIVEVGEFRTYARVFYRGEHAPIIHLVTDHLTQKFSE